MMHDNFFCSSKKIPKKSFKKVASKLEGEREGVRSLVAGAPKKNFFCGFPYRLA